MFKKFFVLALFVMAATTEMVQAQVSTSAVPFLLIAPNSRASGMGEAGVALADDGWAIFWNPAGLGFQKESEVSLSHANWLPKFNLPDLWIAHMVYKQQVDELDGTLAAGITYLNLGEIQQTTSQGPDVVGIFKSYEFAVTAGYGTQLSQDLGIGVNARFIRSYLSPVPTEQEKGQGIANGFSFDVSMLYKPLSVPIPFTDENIGGRLNLGFNLSNVGPSLTYIDKAQADPLPMNLKLGLAYKVFDDEFNNLIYILDFNKLLVRRDSTGTADPFYKAFFTSWTDKSLETELREFVVGTGFEYWYGSPKLVGLRVGYFNDQIGKRKFMTFGAGVRYDVYGFDFSYISTFEEQHPLGDTLRFTLLILWGGASL